MTEKPPAEPAPVTALRLAQPDDEHSRAEWEKAAADVLRKARRLTDEDPDSKVWEKLTRTTLDGIAVTPLGVPGGEPTPVRPQRAGAWDVRSLVGAAGGLDPKAANEAALVDLDGGVTSLWVYLDGAAGSTDLAAVLKDVMLDLAPVVLDAPSDGLEVGKALLELADGKNLHPDTNLGVDPLGAMLRGIPIAPEEGEQELVELATLARGADIRSIVVDATAAHDLGASDAQELGWALSVGTAYLRMLTDHGFTPQQAAEQIEFRLAATDEQFPTIAKLRAARHLWATVLHHSGIPVGRVGLDTASGLLDHRRIETTMRIHAVTSRPMLSKYDPYVNMLRGTVAAFAAGVGGADAVTVLPFDAPLGQPQAFGRRIARNVNHLLVDESHVAVVADAAGGSYAVEALTRDLAAKGWAEFQTIEGEWEAGQGLDGFRSRIDAVVAQRETEIAKRKRPLTGLTEFPNLAETLPERDPDPLNDRVRRYGAAFEEMRDDPPAQHAFLATLGPIAQHTARATFASNLLAAGGIAVDVAGATTDAADLASKYDGQPVVVLAGSDEAYATWGESAATALREKGAKHIVIAGQPVDYADDSAAVGVDALAFLTDTREKLA